MSETPQFVVRSRRSETAEGRNDFIFTPEMVRTQDVSVALRQYRLDAWESFKAAPLPTPTEDAWRRTDLRQLRPQLFQLPGRGAFAHLPPPPQDLMQSVTAEKPAGKVLLLPGGVETLLDPALAAQGVIFCDLQSAERNYPDVLAKILGSVVHPQEGKLAGVAGAWAQDGVLL